METPKSFDESAPVPTDHIEKSKEQVFGEQISAYLESPHFLNFLHELPDEYREKALGIVIEYFIINTDGNNVETFQERIKGIHFDRLHPEDEDSLQSAIYMSVVERLGFKEPLNKLDEKVVFDYFVENYIKNGYFFHGFNGTFEDVIREKGLTPDERLWDTEDLKAITEIGTKHGKPMLLGWHSINSEGKIFFDAHTKNMYRYAVASPEWFAHFVAEGNHVEPTGDNKKVFYTRNYDKARANVVQTCRDMALDPEEESRVMAFFEKYWKLLAQEKSKPKLALIKRTAIEPIDKLNDFYTYENFKTFGFDNVLKGLLRWEDSDQSIQEAITPENIVIVDLPEYKAVHI